MDRNMSYDRQFPSGSWWSSGLFYVVFLFLQHLQKEDVDWITNKKISINA